MGLGTTGLNGYTPKHSGTATRMINSLPPQAQKKTTTLQLRISEDVKILFQELCNLNDIDISEALRNYINEAVQRGTL